MINPNSPKIIFLIGIGLLAISFNYTNNSVIMVFSFISGFLFIATALFKIIINRFFKPVSTNMSKKFWPIMLILLSLFFGICYFAEKDSLIKKQKNSNKLNYPPCTIYYPSSESDTYNNLSPEQCQRLKDATTSYKPENNQETLSPTILPVSEKPIKKVSGVTMNQFISIQEGMTYNEVVSILGSSGELLSSSDTAGYKTVMYQWKGTSTMGNMNAMFQNDKMITKAQFGLK